MYVKSKDPDKYDYSIKTFLFVVLIIVHILTYCVPTCLLPTSRRITPPAGSGAPTRRFAN